MGLGRLNPGCREDPCGDCRSCLLWLDGCTLRWDCNLSGMQLLGIGNGVSIISTNEQTGSLVNPPDGIYRIWVGGTIVTELTIDGLPAGCCDASSGASCFESYPDITGLRVNISGCPFDGLNGIYVISLTNPILRIWSASRSIDNGTMAINGIPECAPGTPPYSFDQDYTYNFNCTVNDPRRIGGTLVTNISGWLFLIVRVGQSVYRCGQDVSVSYQYRTLNYQFDDGSYVYCQRYFDLPLIVEEDGGCNDPVSGIMNVDISTATNIDTYDATYFQSCSNWAHVCCGGGVVT